MTEPSPPLGDLLDRLAGSDPNTRMLMQILAQGGVEPERRGADEERRRRARAKLQRLRDEHRRLIERNEELAAAFGACPHCWGDDGACGLCRGRGHPGFMAPEAEAFAELVVPVLERLGWWTIDGSVNGKPNEGDHARTPDPTGRRT